MVKQPDKSISNTLIYQNYRRNALDLTGFALKVHKVRYSNYFTCV